MKLFLVIADGQMVKCFGTRKQACEYVAAAEVHGHLPYKYEFGDGYSQRAAHGLNNDPEMWSISYVNRSTSEKDILMTFFRARGAVEWFWWTPPGESTAKKYIANSYGFQPTSGVTWNINAEFEQVFDI